MSKRRREWRCSRCGTLLGIVEGRRLYFRTARGQDYRVGLPASAVCRKCKALNEIRARIAQAPFGA